MNNYAKGTNTTVFAWPIYYGIQWLKKEGRQFLCPVCVFIFSFVNVSYFFVITFLSYVFPYALLVFHQVALSREWLSLFYNGKGDRSPTKCLYSLTLSLLSTRWHLVGSGFLCFTMGKEIAVSPLSKTPPASSQLNCSVGQPAGRWRGLQCGLSVRLL